VSLTSLTLHFFPWRGSGSGSELPAKLRPTSFRSPLERCHRRRPFPFAGGPTLSSVAVVPIRHQRGLEE
jgi:hypothetical protein